MTGVLEGVELRLHHSERVLSHVFGQTVDLTGIEFAARVAAEQGEYIPQNALSDLGPRQLPGPSLSASTHFELVLSSDRANGRPHATNVGNHDEVETT